MAPTRWWPSSWRISTSTPTGTTAKCWRESLAGCTSAAPTSVIARTAAYVYACAEWVADAFEGKEFLEQVYSRLLNPTSLSLANYIVDLEAGPYAREYLAWNFNSGMAAIDAALAHVLGQ